MYSNCKYYLSNNHIGFRIPKTGLELNLRVQLAAMTVRKNIYLWYSITFFSNATFTLPIWVIFNTQVLGLNNTQAFILGTLPFTIGTLFEVPSGAWADKYGRAKLFRFGLIMFMISVISYTLFTNFYVLFMFQLLGAIGYAMQSGGLEAIVHDSLNGKHKNAAYRSVYGKNQAIIYISRVVTVLFGGILYTLNPKSPFLFTFTFTAIALCISFFIQDKRLEAPTTHSTKSHIIETIHSILREKNIAVFFILLSLYIVSAEAMFALFQPYLLSMDVQISNFGLLFAIISLFSAFGSLTAARVMHTHSIFNIVLVMTVSVVFTATLMLLRMPMLTYAIVIPSAVAFGYISILLTTTAQQAVSSRYQATAASLASLMYTILFSVAAIFVGISIDITSVNTTNYLIVVLSIVSLLMFYRLRKKIQ